MKRFLLAGLLMLTGCAGKITPGSQVYVLAPAQVTETTARAELGDTDAVWALVCHYGAREGGTSQKKARKWAQQGLRLGDVRCKQWMWEHFSD